MSPYDEINAFDAVLRQSLYAFTQKSFQTVTPGEAFLPNWHLEVIADHLERAAPGEIKRLIITVPPRSLKSISASIAFTAWLLGRDPGRQIISVSYSDDLVAKFARETRVVMTSDWYRRVFPGTRLQRATETELTTTRGGGRFATSLGGTLTGRGGNVVIIDDPMKPQDALSETRREHVKQWFTNTLLSRLNNKAEDVIILVMQRLHLDDLAGHLLESEGWVHLDLQAIAERDEVYRLADGRQFVRREGEALHPAREPLPELERLKRSMGERDFSAQYQQRPVPVDGDFFRWSWFKFYTELPARDRGDLIVQSWDTASKESELADYSVCTTWHVKGNEFYLLDVFRDRLEYPALVHKVIQLGLRWNADFILVEDTASGTPLVQDIRERRIEGLPKPKAIKPQGDKVMRAQAPSLKVESGQVFLPARASWLDAFRQEIMAFPGGRYDDQVDSLTLFLNWIDERQKRKGGFRHMRRS